MTRHEFLGLEPDALDRWRDFHEKQEKQFAEERRRERDEDDARRAELAAIEAANLRVAYDQRIAALEEEIGDLQTLFAQSLATIRGALEDLDTSREMIARETRQELRDLKGELAKLHSVLTEMHKERVKSFQQFAREHNDSIDGRPVN
jgi:chromosome segregation ATPase